MLVRASRDGDQFHYLWAARRCLSLLMPDSELVAVTVEGASLNEIEAKEPIEAGEELIDLAEYYGSEDVTKSTLIRYIQIKHSTLQITAPWIPSGLEKTITGFANRYKELAQILGIEELNSKLELWFVSNRSISINFLEAIDDASKMVTARHPEDLKKLERFTGLNGSSLSAFCKLLRFEGNHEGYLEQRSLLFQELGGYLPGSDTDAPVQLKELITKKALSESAENPRITKYDVLRILNTDEKSLFPAECQIEQLGAVIPRGQEAEIIKEIIKAKNRPVIIHAAGGVGKSIISTRINTGLPDGSLCITYDCFGNGTYI